MLSSLLTSPVRLPLWLVLAATALSGAGTAAIFAGMVWGVFALLVAVAIPVFGAWER